MFAEDIVISKNNKRVYIYNRENGKILFLNDEIYGYIETYYSKKMDKNEFLDKFCDIDDRKYIEKILHSIDNLLTTRERHPKTNCAHLVITNRCNLNCIHCSTESGIGSKDMDYKKVDILISNMKKLRLEYITISGGEPLMNTNFENIVNKIKKEMNNVNLILSTNATLINKENIEFIISNFKQIDISIDGYDKKSCDTIRGVGSYEKIISGIRMLKNEGFNDIILSSVFKDESENEKTKFIMFCKDLKVDYKIRAFMPVGRGKKSHDFFIGDENVLPISIPNLYKDSEIKNYEVNNLNCNGGDTKIYIDFDGNVYACEALKESEYKLFNILDKEYTIEELNSKKKSISCKMRNLKMFKNTRCFDCSLNIFCWCCPAVFKNACENNKLNKWCLLMKKNLNRIIWEL